MLKLPTQENDKRSYNNLIVTTSWDDGSISDFKLSKLLEKYSIKATFYIAKSHKWLEKPLTGEEITELDKIHEIGAHTLNHPNLVKMSNKSAKDEITGSKQYLEDLLGHEIKIFCYPHGKYNEDVKTLVKGAGFIGARTCNPDNFNVPYDPYKWHITLHVSNGSPLLTFKIWKLNHLSIRSLIDWEVRAKELFDLALKSGGTYHLWGHSSEIEKNNEWKKLERLFRYISNRNGVKYLSNGEFLRGVLSHKNE